MKTKIRISEIYKIKIKNNNNWIKLANQLIKFTSGGLPTFESSKKFENILIKWFPNLETWEWYKTRNNKIKMIILNIKKIENEKLSKQKQKS